MEEEEVDDDDDGRETAMASPTAAVAAAAVAVPSATLTWFVRPASGRAAADSAATSGVLRPNVGMVARVDEKTD